MMTRLRALARPVAAVEIWPVALLLMASVASTAALPIALAVAALFWPIRWLAYGSPTLRSAADWPLALLFVSLPVTLWATALPAVTQVEVLRLLTGLALYYAIVNWAGHAHVRRHLRWLALGLAAVGLALALAAPFTVAWIVAGKLLLIPEGLYRRLPLLLADPIHPNIMAGALVLLLPLALALPLFAWRELRWFQRLLTVAAALAMLGILLISKSRGALLAVGVVLLLLPALRWRRGWLLAPAVALTAATALWWFGPSQALEALTSTQALGGLDGRLEVWSRGLYMAQDFPFTGIGMGTFRQVANAMYPFFLAGPDADIPHAHNLLLQIAVDQGLPGLIMWLAALLLVIAGAWSVYRHGRRADDRWLSALGAGLLASQAALLVHGLLDAALWGTRPALLAWAVWGLAMAAQASVASPTHPMNRVTP